MLVGVMFLVGCATKPQQTAVEIVERVAEDVRAANIEDAVKYLTAEAQAQGGTWRVNSPDDTQAIETHRTATWKRVRGRAVRLGYGNDGWRIRHGVLRFLDSKSPRGALARFARGVLGADYRLLLSLLPDGDRKEWGAGALMRVMERKDVRQAWRSLASALESQAYELRCVEMPGECQALTRIGTVVRLKSEAEHWKIVALEPFATYISNPSESGAEN